MQCKSVQKQYILLLSTVISMWQLCFFTSCEKTFNPRDNYKRITLVYGLINATDTVHYIRISKAFLGDGKIIEMAQNIDSSTYPVDEIEVKIFEDQYRLVGICPNFFDTILEKSEQVLVETKITDSKESGLFYAPNQRVYYFTKIFNMPYKDKENYLNKIRIEIKNNKTGQVTYGETPIVNSWDVKIPRQESLLNLNPALSSMNAQWENANHGRIYDVYYTFSYTEARYDDPDTTHYKVKSLTCHLGSYTSLKTGDLCPSASSLIEKFYYSPSSLYSQIKKDIASDGAVWRLPHADAKITIWCGSEDMYYYNNVNDPNSTWIQDRPDFTNIKTKLDTVNIDNVSYGLFASRLVQIVPIRLSSDMIMKYLPATERQFVNAIPAP